MNEKDGEIADDDEVVPDYKQRCRDSMRSIMASKMEPPLPDSCAGRPRPPPRATSASSAAASTQEDPSEDAYCHMMMCGFPMVIALCQHTLASFCARPTYKFDVAFVICMFRFRNRRQAGSDPGGFIIHNSPFLISMARAPMVARILHLNYVACEDIQTTLDQPTVDVPMNAAKENQRALPLISVLWCFLWAVGFMNDALCYAPAQGACRSRQRRRDMYLQM